MALGVVADRDDLVQHHPHLGELAGQEALDQREGLVEDGDPFVLAAAAEVDVVAGLVGVRLERGDRVVVDGGEVRDLADAPEAALEAEAARVVGERALHRLALAPAAGPARRRRRRRRGGWRRSAGRWRRPAGPARRRSPARRGAARRAPRAPTAPSGMRPRSAISKSRCGMHLRAGRVDARPEGLQLVAQRQALQRRAAPSARRSSSASRAGRAGSAWRTSAATRRARGAARPAAAAPTARKRWQQPAR